MNADTVSDQRTDAVQDVFDGGVDLASVAVADIPSTDTSIISHLLFGLIPLENVENQYLTFADLDNDATTGGSPADLGFTTAFQGAELVTRVVVGPGHDTTPTVWIYRNGSFEKENRDFLTEVATLVETESGIELADTVTIALPTSVRGPATVPFRLQAIAEQLQGDLELDILPNGPLDGARPVVLAPPIFPVCSVEPMQAKPGDTIRVDVTGLLPNENAHVVLGDVLVATGSIDGNGDASIELILPGDTRSGPRLVTVGVDGTALTADCLIDIPGDREVAADHPAVGTWRLASEDAPFGGGQAYLAIHGDGTVTGVDPGAGTGLGSWTLTGPRTANLRIVFQDIDLSADRAAPGTLTAQGSISVSENGDAVISPITFEARTPDGTSAGQREGTATATRVSSDLDVFAEAESEGS